MLLWELWQRRRDEILSIVGGQNHFKTQLNYTFARLGLSCMQDAWSLLRKDVMASLEQTLHGWSVSTWFIIALMMWVFGLTLPNLSLQSTLSSCIIFNTWPIWTKLCYKLCKFYHSVNVLTSWATVYAVESPSSSTIAQLCLFEHIAPTSAIPVEYDQVVNACYVLK